MQEGHDAGDTSDKPTSDTSLSLKWRQKEKLKTTAVALVLCLNIGVDPPDVIKISPCARLECWVDPNSMQPAKALEAIGRLIADRHSASCCLAWHLPAVLAITVSQGRSHKL